jgi:two-component system, chemotaxis family, CheB/CheR fusion protein
MKQDILAGQAVQLLRATVPQGNGTGPWPIALELVAEAQWQADGLGPPPAHLAVQALAPVQGNHSRVGGQDPPDAGPEILLMASDSATLILDRQLIIKRFTLKAGELLDISQLDEGQPLTDIAGRLGFASLVEDACEVLRSLVHIEREIRSVRDKWFLTRLLPIRATNGGINGVVITFFDITQSKATEERLRQSQQQIEMLTTDLEALVAEQTEQVRRLASEVLITEQQVQQSVSQLLHDELQQVLFSIQIQVDMIAKMLPAGEQILQAQLHQLRAAADLALHVTRRVVVDLTPPLFLSESFMESLKWLAALMKQRHGLEVEVQGAVQPGWPEEEVSKFLIQTVRELLFNVVKHAGVNQAKVEVSEGRGRLSIAVSDHGHGFDGSASNQQSGGLGLFNIRNRLELFGGQFDLQSQIGQGTRATVVVLASHKYDELLPEHGLGPTTD